MKDEMEKVCGMRLFATTASALVCGMQGEAIPPMAAGAKAVRIHSTLARLSSQPPPAKSSIRLNIPY